MKGKQGFASMDADKQRAIAVKGGKAAHLRGVAHVWDSLEAKAAGLRGGKASAAARAAKKAAAAVTTPTV